MIKNHGVEISGKKGSKRVKNGVFQELLEKSSFFFLDFLHVIRGQLCAHFGENCMFGKNLVPEEEAEKWSKWPEIL